MKKVSMASLVLGLFVLALCLVLPLSAYSADKLIVKDAAGVNTVFVVTDDAKLGVGTATPTSRINVVGEGDIGLFGMEIVAPFFGANFTQRRARGTVAAKTAVQNGDLVGGLIALGYDGSAYRAMGRIALYVDGTPGASDMPGRIEFRTTPDGSASEQTRMTINNSGAIIINSLIGTYTGGSAYVCVNNSGQIFASETACP